MKVAALDHVLPLARQGAAAGARGGGGLRRGRRGLDRRGGGRGRCSSWTSWWSTSSSGRVEVVVGAAVVGGSGRGDHHGGAGGRHRALHTGELADGGLDVADLLAALLVDLVDAGGRGRGEQAHEQRVLDERRAALAASRGSGGRRCGGSRKSMLPPAVASGTWAAGPLQPRKEVNPPLWVMTSVTVGELVVTQGSEARCGSMPPRPSERREVDEAAERARDREPHDRAPAVVAAGEVARQPARDAHGDRRDEGARRARARAGRLAGRPG